MGRADLVVGLVFVRMCREEVGVRLGRGACVSVCERCDLELMSWEVVRLAARAYSANSRLGVHPHRAATDCNQLMQTQWQCSILRPTTHLPTRHIFT